MSEPVGTFCLVLHSHLPCLANHGRWPVGEEWLYQAWAHSYLPVVELLERLAAQGRRDVLTLGVTPVLAALAALGLVDEVVPEPAGGAHARRERGGAPVRVAAGVDVRVIVNGTATPINPWRENRAAAAYLRGDRARDDLAARARGARCATPAPARPTARASASSSRAAARARRSGKSATRTPCRSAR